MKSRITEGHWLITTPIAHRGLHGNGLCENSLPAFENAVKEGYPIETDLHLTKDGILVCFHDDNLKRMTGEDCLIWDKTYAELCELNLGDTDQKIPTFRQLLDAVNGKVPLLIEIKTQAKQNVIEKPVIDELNGYNGEYAIQSFDPRIMANIRKLAPNVLRGQLAGPWRGNLPWWQYVALKNMWLNFMSKPDFINYFHGILPKKFNVPLLCYTVRTEEERERCDKYADGYVFEEVRPSHTKPKKII